MAERVFVGLGANLGDAVTTVNQAFAALRELPQTSVVAQSALYGSTPVDAQGPDFVNAVAELSTALAPELLLQQLHAIEARFGRERPFVNAPRTLDLDLLLYGDRSIATSALTVPHPRLHRRAFVLLPLLSLAPGLSHPLLGSLSAHLPGVADQAVHALT